MNQIERILEGLDNCIELSKAEAVQTIFGAMDERIFNRGLKADETSIGQYSKGYKKTREKNGLQTSFIDLTFTTSLKNSIVNDSIDTIKIKNDYGVAVSGYASERFGVIFEASNNERDIFQKILNENINKLINGH